jgi:uncharacterized membrane protein YdfJ with MMPL/SSD domain
MQADWLASQKDTPGVMRNLIVELNRLVRRHRLLVLGAWIALLAAAVPLALHRGDRLTDAGYGVSGSQSVRVDERLARSFGGARHATLAAMLIPGRGTSAAEMSAALRRIAVATRTVAHVGLDPPARRQALAAIAAAGRRQRTLLVPLRVTVSELTAPDVTGALHARLGLHDGERGPVVLHLVGESALYAGLTDLSKRDLARAEQAGFPIVALILVAVFGSLLAALLPLALGLVSVLVTGAIIYLLSLSMEMSIFSTNMASMIGIGVAVDYSLFVLARFRQELAGGASSERACAVALGSSGVAVAFSGMTVIVSLAGLYLVHATAIRSMALGAIVVVAVSVLGAVTLLPAVISLLGSRLGRSGVLRARLARLAERAAALRGRRRPAARRAAGAAGQAGFWEAWTRQVTRRPAIAAALSAGLLVALALPALHLHMTEGALRQLPPSNETRQGFEAAAKLTGRGAFTPLKAIAPAAGARRVRRLLSADPAVSRVETPTISRDRRSVLLRAVLRTDAESPQAMAAVRRLRASLPAGVLLGGNTAGLVDFQAEVEGSMWKVALFVMGMAFVVLLVLLRSLLLPLKAVVMDLLSVGAAFGVLELAFGTIDTLTPPIVLAVVFGLSMDYEVFLLSRIRERYAATGDTRAAVAQGLSASAGTITSAALIMVCVFSVFALTGVPTIKQLGLGSAVAIAVDASVVRLVLVPAVMSLLGAWNWWLPRRLARLLPEVAIEIPGG